MNELFLICALALPASHHTRPPIVSWHAVTDEEAESNLTDWLKKHDEVEDVFIHETPQEGKLKEWGWERVPFTIKGKQIWIRRKPQNDKKMRGSENAQRKIEESA